MACYWVYLRRGQASVRGRWAGWFGAGVGAGATGPVFGRGVGSWVVERGGMHADARQGESA